MPKPKPVNEQVVEDYQKKIMKAEGNDRIRLMLEAMYFETITGSTGFYDSVNDSIVNYFIPNDKNGNLRGNVTREKLKELTKFIDEEVLLPFQEFREKNPNHSDQWYEEHFADTKAGMYMAFFRTLTTPISFVVSDYKLQFFGEENQDRFGRKRQPGDTVLSTLLAEASKERRDQMPPEKVAKLEQAEATLRHGTSAMSVRTIQKEVSTTDMTDDMAGWTNVEMETAEAYQTRQRMLEAAESEHKLTEQELVECQIRYYKNIDFSFIKDDVLQKSMKELHQDPKTFDEMEGKISKEFYGKNKALFEKLDNFSEKLEKADHTFWINSGTYNDVKKGVKNLRKALVGGEVPENRAALKKAYQDLADFCDAYERKNPGVRKQTTGNKRKEIIAELKQFLEEKQPKLEKKQAPVNRERVPFTELKVAQDKEQNKPSRKNSVFAPKVQASEKTNKVEGPKLGH